MNIRRMLICHVRLSSFAVNAGCPRGVGVGMFCSEFSCLGKLSAGFAVEISLKYLTKSDRTVIILLYGRSVKRVCTAIRGKRYGCFAARKSIFI